MSAIPTQPRPTDQVPVTPGRHGRSATRGLLQSDDDDRASRLVLLSLWMLLGQLLVAYLFVTLIALGEYSQLRSAVALLMIDSSALLISLLTAATTAAYVLIWHSLGSRGAVVRSLAQRSAGDGGRPHRRGFGVWGPLAATTGLLVLGVVAWRRADVLAQDYAEYVRRMLDEQAVVEVPNPAVIETAVRTAYESVFWPDLAWTLAVLALLAAASALVGLVTAPLKKAITLALGERRLVRAQRRLARQSAREAAAHRELASRVRARESRMALAELHREELPERFEQAKQRFRITLAALLGDPARTSSIFAKSGAGPRADR